MRVVLDRDEVSARSRRGERYRRGAGDLRDRRAYTVTVGVKHITPSGKAEEGGRRNAARDRLRDRKGVAPGWRRHPHPVEHHTGVDVVDRPPANRVIDSA